MEIDPGGMGSVEAAIRAGGKTLLWPVTAPERNQTVVVW